MNSLKFQGVHAWHISWESVLAFFIVVLSIWFLICLQNTVSAIEHAYLAYSEGSVVGLITDTVGNKLLFEKHFRVERKANLMGLEPREL